MAVAKKAAAAVEKDEDEKKEPTAAETRAAEKAAAIAAGPIVKPRKKLVAPSVEDLYGWAVNREKVTRAHIYVQNEGRTEDNPAGVAGLASLKPESAEFEQAVMDHYVTHGGYVRGQEKASVVGRHQPIRATSGPDAHDGETTGDIVRKGQARMLGADEDDD
jgi:hypothetical protein